MSKQIKLTKGYHAIVDDEDFEWLMEHSWCVRDSYPRARYALSWIKGKIVCMHRLILMHHGLLEEGLVVDHIDGKGLNNQKNNLRACTHAENTRNRKGPFKHGYLGICRCNSTKNPWRASIRVNGKNIYLGVFLTKENAARAYDAAARKYHGEFATLNFPLSHERGAF